MNARGLVASLAACLAIAGCSDDKFHGDKYSLTVFAYNGVTGEAIPSADLAKGLAIYEGAAKATPGVLDSGVAGAVIFQDLEADYAAGNKVFPIRANVSGYQAYQGEVSFKVADASINVNKVDDVYAQVGYMRLWPVGFHAPDYTFTVLYAGKPVPNAAVQLSANQYGYAEGNNQNDQVIQEIYDGMGMLPAIAGTTDANGRVTFAGASLVLDVYYTFKVFPLAVDGVTLQETSSNITVGSSSPDQVVNIVNPDTSLTHGLFVKTVSPNLGAVQTDGVLTLTFNMPVTASSLFAGNTEFSVTPGTGTFTVDPTFGTPAVTAKLSPDGLTLTLTPNYAAGGAGTPLAGATLTYAAGANAFVVQGYPNDAINLGSLSVGGLSGQALSNYLTVTVKAP